MSDETEYTTVPVMNETNAILLLDAAQALKHEPEVVRTTSDGFVVPTEVADKAFGKGKTEPTKAAAAKAEKLADEKE